METPNIPITREVQDAIVYALREIGFPSHVKGYGYAKTSLEFVLNHPESIEAITKELYPTVARIHRTTSSRVERALRHGIELVYDRNDPNTLCKKLGYPSWNKDRLTNSEFLAAMAENLRMSLGDSTQQKEEVPQVNKETTDYARLEQLRRDLIALGVLKED